MASDLVKISANFETTLASKLTVGGTSATLTSATDKDGTSLPAGTYGFTLNEGEANEEHITANLSGTSLTSIQAVTRTSATATSGAAKLHRIGASVKITNHPALRRLTDLFDGTTNLDAANPLEYDGTATINANNQLATKKYVDDADALAVHLAGDETITGVKTFTSTSKAKYDTNPTFSADEELVTKKYVDDIAIAGAADASQTVKGIVEEATQSEMDAGTDTGGTSAKLFAPPSVIQQYVSTQIAASGSLLDASVSNDTTSPVTVSIPADTLSTGNVVRMRVYGEFVLSNGASFTVVYGSTTMATAATAGTGTMTARGFVEITLFGAGTTSSQEANIVVMVGPNTFNSGSSTTPTGFNYSGNGTATEDSTTNLNLQMTYSGTFTAHNYTVEILK